MSESTVDREALTRFLDECEPRKAWGASCPWVIIHIPSGQQVPTWRVLGGNGESAGTRFQAYGHRLKRDAAAALELLRDEARVLDDAA